MYTEVNGSELSKDCGLGPAGFPKDLPVRHRNWRFPLSDLFACHQREAGLPLRPHRNPQLTFSLRNSLGVFLDAILVF